jgi:uncharacterized membrane protein
MNTVLRIAESMLVDRLISNKAPVTGESKLKLFLVTFSLVTGIAGLALLYYSAYLYLSIIYPMTMVTAIMGVLTLLLSLLGVLTLLGIHKYKMWKMQQIREEVMSIAKEALAIFEKEAAKPVNDNPKSSVLASVMAGYAVGNRFI